MNFRFLFMGLLLLVTLIALTQFSFEKITGFPWPHWGFYFLFGWLWLAALGGYALVESKIKAKPKDFVNTFMLTSGLRMMVSVLIVVILVLQLPDTGKYISIYYVAGYLCFLVLEVAFLFKRSKGA